MSSASRTAVGIVCGVLALIGVLIGLNGLTKFKAVDQSSVCVVKHGGPFDDRKFADVRQPGDGVSFIGLYNSQQCIPVSQRNFQMTSDPNAAGDEKTIDFLETPSRDAVPVRPEGTAYFNMTTDEDAVRVFAQRFFTRKFGKKFVYEDGGFPSFLDQNLRPSLEGALRESIGSYDCTELNNSCQYVVNAQEAVKGNVQKVDTGQNLAKASQSIANNLFVDVNRTLRAPSCGGLRLNSDGTVNRPSECRPFFENVTFTLRKVTFDPRTQQKIQNAINAQTEVATARLHGQQRVAAATADVEVAKQRAEAIKVSAQAYRDNPGKLRIDLAKAICGGSGCQNLQVLGGGNASILLNGK